MQFLKVFFLCTAIYSGGLLAQNCSSGMEDKALKSVIGYLKSNNNELSRLSYAKDLLVRECFTCDQAIEIMKTFSRNSSRETYLIELKKGFLVDKENIHKINTFIIDQE